MRSIIMMSIQELFIAINTIIGSDPFLLPIFFVSAIVKIFVLGGVLCKKFNSIKLKTSYFLLLGALTGSIFCDTEWLFMIIKRLFFNDPPLRLFVFWRRLSWASMVASYQLFILCIENLIDPKYLTRWRNRIFFFISCIFFIAFVSYSVFHYNCWSPVDKHWSEFVFQKASLVYIFCVLAPWEIIRILWGLARARIPNILVKQLRVLMFCLFIPMWLADLIQLFPYFVVSFGTIWFNTNSTLACISSILMVFILFYCSRKMLGLRFFNWNKQVQAPVDIYFLKSFKTVLNQLGQVTTMQELTHITRVFFKEVFAISFDKVFMQIRSEEYADMHELEKDNAQGIRAEEFMSSFSKEEWAFIKKQRILVYDELVFSDFYEPCVYTKKAIDFLDYLHADIFLPIYVKDEVIAYIIVDRFARNVFYASTDYDEMLIFGQYLGSIIHLIQNKNITMLIKQEKELREELYNKHQEVSQYKESVRSFLRTNSHKEIGIIFYKNRHFSFGNKAAIDLIKINPNMQEGHPLSKALRDLVYHLESYKTSRMVYAKDNNGTKLMLSGIPNPENNTTIIMVHYPEITDVVKRQIDMLRDPSEWDYLLYLETTQSGKLIHQMVPGTGETLLNFKIILLKTALSKKATLLTMHEQDLQQMVTVLHHISLRDTLHMIELQQPVEDYSVAINLFGINALFNTNKGEVPLLKKLDTVGTLCIKNIHYLDLETQNYLAEFIRYGYFRMFKSDTKIASDVRIICSASQNLQTLVQEGKFSQDLYNELKYTTLAMPSLNMLPEDELHDLTEGFSEQALANQAYKNLLSLSERDKKYLASQRPASLQELKNRVQQMLVVKSKRNNVYDEILFDATYNVSDSELIEAASLGKNALKNQKVMALLWDKFKSQNKIAMFLGVNRSTINRRCKQYNLI